jgi:hypothetical protein
VLVVLEDNDALDRTTAADPITFATGRKVSVGLPRVGAVIPHRTLNQLSQFLRTEMLLNLAKSLVGFLAHRLGGIGAVFVSRDQDRLGAARQKSPKVQGEQFVKRNQVLLCDLGVGVRGQGAGQKSQQERKGG